MKVSIIREDNVVVVDGEAREVDLSDLEKDIHAIQFDSDKNLGWVEYTEDAVEEVPIRDFERENELVREAKRQNKREPDGVVVRRVPRPRVNREITNFGEVAQYVARWRAAKRL